ncbi:MAG: DUF4255 domain-containing protein [Betaproteobacteria bacterium]|nr:DUF4255 domain-containing protein [Betaproteobacteria bacterium]
MSTALGIAAVTAVLKDLLNNGLVDHDLSASVGNVTVSALPPDRIDIEGGNQTSLLNLFLYQVTPNAGWRNTGLPARDREGHRLANPPLALDLHYLLMAYGAEELHAEILLGFGMQLLHETPVLARDAIRRSLAPPSPVAGGSGLPQNLRALFSAELAEQVEQIRIQPATVGAEEISRLWTGFQSKFRLSAAYEASVVLIESRQSTRSALPVKQRNLYVVPLHLPTIEEVLAQAGPADEPRAGVPVLDGQRLVLRGRQLAADNVVVSIDGTGVTPLPADVTAQRVTVAVPAGTPAGLHGVQVVHRRAMGTPPASHRGVESNAMPFLIAPRIDAQSAANVQGTSTGPRSAELHLTVRPAIGATQRVMLAMNEFSASSADTARGYTFALPPRIDLQNPPPNLPAPVEDVVVPVSGVTAGTYLIRVQVDGVASPLAVETSVASPDYNRYTGPTVTLP